MTHLFFICFSVGFDDAIRLELDGEHRARVDILDFFNSVLEQCTCSDRSHLLLLPDVQRVWHLAFHQEAIELFDSSASDSDHIDFDDTHEDKLVERPTQIHSHLTKL